MPRALVIGGGIGGLAAAIALRQSDVEVSVFEQAPELREIGAGLSIWSNAYKALELLGVGEAVGAITAPLELIETRGTTGRVLSTLPLGKVHERLGSPSVGIHRRELLAALASVLPSDLVRTNARLVSTELDGQRVVARFEDGREEAGDVLIGADGIFSTVRSQMFPTEDPRYGDYVVWRGVAETEMPNGWPVGASVRTISRDQHFGVVELTEGRSFWYATRNQPRAEPEPGGRKATLLGHFGDWHDPIPQLLEATPDNVMLRHGLYRMKPLRSWSRGPMTLLGDAAHPMAPSLGQGACQALEDAVVLGRAFRKESDVPTALRNYEGKRRRRAISIVRWSRFFAWQEQLRNPALVAARDIQTRFSPKVAGEALFRRFLAFEPG